jgi:site-specific DNA-methyltransferase (adenine-specific)
MKTKHAIIFGDSRNMAEVRDSSVQLIITSPPYWQLKDYGSKYQIGFNDSYEDYINNLNVVWKECHRVLENGCKLCINIGDQFARSVYYGRYKVIPIRTEIIKFCETIGFDYMGAIIWQKVTTTHTTGGATVMGSYPYPRNGILKIDYEFILIFKKHGKTKKISREIKDKSKLTSEEWNTYFSGHWNFPGEKQNGHLAMFPEELPKRLIKMFSFVCDTILDPFLGSGTTTLAAKNNDRNSIGFEINKEFQSIIRNKLEIEQPKLYSDFEITFKDQSKFLTQEQIKKSISRLPYIFKDPLKFDSKIDPRKLQFGSKIDNNSNNSDNEYHSVKKIISPELMQLDNGLYIRLIGIKTNPDTQKEAVDFLKTKLNGSKIFIKFDKEKYDSKNNLLVYLYLKNKTFVNAHLVKNKLVKVDNSKVFKHLNKFLSLSGYHE